MKRILILLLAVFTVICMVACTDEANPNELSVKPIESDSDSTPSKPADPTPVVSDDVSDSASADSSEEASADTSKDESDETSQKPSDKPNNNNKPSEESKEETSATAPIKMVGTWKRVSVETDGDVNGGGNCTIVITGTSESNMRISYTDKDYPEMNYSNMSLIFASQDEFQLFGNGEWCAAVDQYFGPHDTNHMLALFDDGKIHLMAMFDFDGGLGSSIEVFEKVK